MCRPCAHRFARARSPGTIGPRVTPPPPPTHERIPDAFQRVMLASALSMVFIGLAAFGQSLEAVPESKHKHDKKCQLCHGLNWSRDLGKQEVTEKVVSFIKEKFGV